MDDHSFQDRIERDVEARKIARRVLGVEENASPHDLKRAWRKACKENHPDRNPADCDAGRRFAAINCAYRLLAYGEPCEMLIEADPSQYPTSEDHKYRLDNAWGLFLWWRKTYF